LRQVGNGQGFQPVQNNPQRMAEKRAEAQALRKAFHIPLPSIEDIGLPEEDDLPIVKVSVVEPKQLQDAPERKTETPETEVKPIEKPVAPQPGLFPKTDRDLTKILTIKDMVDAVKRDFGMSPQQAMKENNVSSWSELTKTPKEAYQIIASARQ